VEMQSEVKPESEKGEKEPKEEKVEEGQREA